MLTQIVPDIVLVLLLDFASFLDETAFRTLEATP